MEDMMKKQVSRWIHKIVYGGFKKTELGVCASCTGSF